MSRKQLAHMVLTLGTLTAISPISIDMSLPAFPQMAQDLGELLGTIFIAAFVFSSACRRTGNSFTARSLTATASDARFFAVLRITSSRRSAGPWCPTSTIPTKWRPCFPAHACYGAEPILGPIAGRQLPVGTGRRGTFRFIGVFGLPSNAALDLHVARRPAPLQVAAAGAEERNNILLSSTSISTGAGSAPRLEQTVFLSQKTYATVSLRFRRFCLIFICFADKANQNIRTTSCNLTCIQLPKYSIPILVLGSIPMCFRH